MAAPFLNHLTLACGHGRNEQLSVLIVFFISVENVHKRSVKPSKTRRNTRDPLRLGRDPHRGPGVTTHWGHYPPIGTQTPPGSKFHSESKSSWSGGVTTHWGHCPLRGSIPTGVMTQPLGPRTHRVRNATPLLRWGHDPLGSWPTHCDPGPTGFETPLFYYDGVTTHGGHDPPLGTLGPTWKGMEERQRSVRGLPWLTVRRAASPMSTTSGSATSSRTSWCTWPTLLDAVHLYASPKKAIKRRPISLE